MTEQAQQLKVAVAQAAARPFDREGMVEKVLRMTKEAAHSGAGLVVEASPF